MHRPPSRATARVARLTRTDLPKLERFLNQRLHQSMFMLSNLYSSGFEDTGGPRNGAYVGAFAGSELIGAACHYRLGNLLLCAPSATKEIVLAAIQASQRPIRAIVGPEDQVDIAVDQLGLQQRATTCDEREGLFRLALSELIVPPALHHSTSSSEPIDRLYGRVLASRDVNTIADWSLRYRVETVGDKNTPSLRSQILENTRTAVDRGDVWVLEHQNKLVAKTAFNAQTPCAVQVGGVWTPHALRGRGYGRCVVASHLLDARDRGLEIAVLFVGDQNRPAQRAYLALGFNPVGRYRVLILEDAVDIAN